MDDQILKYNHFNSRPHKEADRDFQGAAYDGNISTHGLTRRPTNQRLTI